MNRDVEDDHTEHEETELCSLCFGPKVNKNGSEDANWELPYKDIRALVSELTLAAEEGCQKCSLVLDAIATWCNGQTVDPSCTFTIIFYLKELFICFTNEINGTNRLEVVFSPQHYAAVNPTPGNNIWRLPDTRVLSGSTSSDSTFRQLADLIKNCERYHKSCDRPFANPLPKRILEIARGSVYLYEPKKVSARYACLSHCWGPLGPATRLTKASLSSLSQGLAICQLPKTFRDSVVVCQTLGISYIWIDALCIIQDSLEDWEEAANTMANVYENACITIAAASAADSTQGLFSPDRIARRLSKHSQFYVQPFFPRLVSNYHQQFHSRSPWPLFSRAWVYQERKLSPRIVYFSMDKVYWECKYMFTSEDDRDLKVREHDHLGDGRDRTQDHAQSWREIIQEYAGLRLTYEKDRLPAIAAVAYKISLLREPSDVYLAGMWKNSLISDFCWYRDPKAERRSEQTVPSWSWASTPQSAIEFNKVWERCKAEVVSLSYEIVGGAYLGLVKNCKLVMRGYVLPLTETRGLSQHDISIIHRDTIATLDFMLNAPRILVKSHGFNFKSGVFFPDFNLNTAIPPLECGASLKLMLFTNLTYSFGGVVFRQISKDSDQYERIGFISILVGKCLIREAEIDCLLQSVPLEDILIV